MNDRGQYGRHNSAVGTEERPVEWSWWYLAAPVTFGVGMFYWLSRSSPEERALEKSAGRLDREIAATLSRSPPHSSRQPGHAPKSPRQLDAEHAALAEMLKNARTDADLDKVVETAKTRRLGQP
jgi:hypothetical protein